MCIRDRDHNGNEIRIKLFKNDNPNILEKEVNDWLSRSYFKILKIHFYPKNISISYTDMPDYRRNFGK